MKKNYTIAISFLVIIALAVSVNQYINVLSINAAGAVPNPGHLWSEMQSDSNTIQVSGQKITNLATPTVATDAVNKAYADGLGSIPSGVILLWSGSVATIPTGWALCNGSNGTPDLRDKFVVGAGNTYAVAATGGEATHTLTEAEMPSHSHSDPAHSHSFSGSGSLPQNGAQCSSGTYVGNIVSSTGCPMVGSFSVSISGTTSSGGGGSTGGAGGGGAHNNLPPYYSLAYIMKL